MKESSMKTKCTIRGLINGLTEGSTSEVERIPKCKGKESSLDKMDEL